ncbi:unnamed protein product [Callosobruchus maculatus]|uniref:Uncharacterized protein n=1 Tax=Callosobruchus maculatus TaxID=64391 RepID=A0A653DI25_CALMS|nr:unnamed protein product [Callosobruchus maculatus]
MNRLKSNKGATSSRGSAVGRTQSALSVSAVDWYLQLPATHAPPSPAVSSITLSPGRIRNIDQDIENIRASRQDNPIIQQIIASRKSIIDSLDMDEEADHTNLMTKELSLDLDVDPLSIPEMHEHMIRSPPPINWPKSPDYRAFEFSQEDETFSVDCVSTTSIANTSSKSLNHYQRDMSRRQGLRSWHSGGGRRSISPVATPSTPPPRCQSQPSSGGRHHYQERFSLLSSSAALKSAEDSVRLMAATED